MKIKHVILALALSAAGSASASAELRHVEMKTLGMDWETCAHAVRVAMQKVTGVSSVRVSLNEGLTVLDLKPGNNVTLARLREVIRNNGFVTKEAQVVAVGTVSAAGGAVVFAVGGSQERFTLQPGSGQQRQRYDDLRARSTAGPSGPLAVTGSVDIVDPKAITMTVTAIAQP